VRYTASSTPPQALDDALRIGLPPAAITELVGPAGVGKSQFCYSLALQVCW
jgi:RecA/RadA recombinase